MQIDQCICDPANLYWDCIESSSIPNHLVCACRNSEENTLFGFTGSFNEIFGDSDANSCSISERSHQGFGVHQNLNCFLKAYNHTFIERENQKGFLRCSAWTENPRFTVCVIDDDDSTKRIGTGYIPTSNIWNFHAQQNAEKIHNRGCCVIDHFSREEIITHVDSAKEYMHVILPNVPSEPPVFDYEYTTSSPRTGADADQVISLSDDDKAITADISTPEPSELRTNISITPFIEKVIPDPSTSVTKTSMKADSIPEEPDYIDLLISNKVPEIENSEFYFNQSNTSSPYDQDAQNHPDTSKSPVDLIRYDQSATQLESKIDSISDSRELSWNEYDYIPFLIMLALALIVLIIGSVLYLYKKNRRNRPLQIQNQP